MPLLCIQPSPALQQFTISCLLTTNPKVYWGTLCAASCCRGHGNVAPRGWGVRRECEEEGPVAQHCSQRLMDAPNITRERARRPLKAGARGGGGTERCHHTLRYDFCHNQMPRPFPCAEAELGHPEGSRGFFSFSKGQALPEEPSALPGQPPPPLMPGTAGHLHFLSIQAFTPNVSYTHIKHTHGSNLLTGEKTRAQITKRPCARPASQCPRGCSLSTHSHASGDN